MNTTEQPPQRQRLTEVCRLCSTIHESGLVGAATATGEQPGRRFNSVIEAVEKHLHIQIEPENGICNFCFCFVRKLRDFSEHCQKVDKMFQMATNLAKDEHSLTDWDEIRTICEIDNFTWKVVDPSELLLGNSSDDDHIPDFVITPRILTEIAKEEPEEEVYTTDSVEMDFLNDLHEELTFSPPEYVVVDASATTADIIEIPETATTTTSEPFEIIIEVAKKRKVTTTANKISKQSLITTPKYACPECDKVLASRASFNTHKQSHGGGKSYQCQVCSKRFVRSDVLRNHMLTHTGQRKFGCDECEKTFYRAADLRSHQKIHDDAKPFSCTECEKTFKRAGDLRSHNLTHERKQDFLCLTCNKKFLSFGGLKYHMKVHADEKPYGCPKCELRFRQSGNMKKHLTKAHS